MAPQSVPLDRGTHAFAVLICVSSSELGCSCHSTNAKVVSDVIVPRTMKIGKQCRSLKIGHFHNQIRLMLAFVCKNACGYEKKHVSKTHVVESQPSAHSVILDLFLPV